MNTTINATLNVPAYKAWYMAHLNGFWTLDNDDNISVTVSEPFNAHGEEYRTARWNNGGYSVSVDVPARFIILSSK
jgi:hypothetical protein